MKHTLWPHAIAVGVFLAGVDQRPGFDDAGVLAFAILIVSAVFGAAEPRRPWRWALAVGLPIPLCNIALHGNFGSLIAIGFALAGAYLGAFARRQLRPA
jgi:hypothetical protein